MAAFGQTLTNSSQPATPFDISGRGGYGDGSRCKNYRIRWLMRDAYPKIGLREFPVLGTGSAHQNSNQGWGRASTQSPSQSQGRQTQDELYQNSHIMDDFAVQRVVGQGQGSGAIRNPRLGSNEDFPALPSSSTISDGLGDRKGNFLLAQALQGGSHLDILSQDSQRQSFLNGPLGSSGLQTGAGRQQGGGGGSRSQNLNGWWSFYFLHSFVS
ncbi:hypothetical protein ABW21_db0204633 [Orbilia brochopaga]|nr:hypothetical protein ABW21_db0204633 [Drechslerella brochopaga]